MVFLPWPRSGGSAGRGGTLHTGGRAPGGTAANYRFVGAPTDAAPAFGITGPGTGVGAGAAGNEAQPWSARLARLLDSTPASETVSTESPTTIDRRMVGVYPSDPGWWVTRPISLIPAVLLTLKPTPCCWKGTNARLVRGQKRNA